MKPLPVRDQDSPWNLRVVPVAWQEPKPSPIWPLWGKWFLNPHFQEEQNMRCVNISGGCPDPDASVVVQASQSSLFQEVLEDEKFSSDWSTPRIIGVKNLSLEALEKFINFSLHWTHCYEIPHYPRPTEISSDNCPSCSMLGTMQWWF